MTTMETSSNSIDEKPELNRNPMFT